MSLRKLTALLNSDFFFYSNMWKGINHRNLSLHLKYVGGEVYKPLIENKKSTVLSKVW